MITPTICPICRKSLFNNQGILSGLDQVYCNTKSVMDYWEWNHYQFDSSYKIENLRFSLKANSLYHIENNYISNTCKIHIMDYNNSIEWAPCYSANHVLPYAKAVKLVTRLSNLKVFL